MKRLFLLLFVIAIMTGLVLTSVAQEKPKAAPAKRPATAAPLSKANWAW